LLSHVISKGGIFVDPSKVQDVLSWKAPKSVSDIQDVLSWNPMTKMLEKDMQFEWTPACEASFQELKKRLTTAPVMVMPDMEKSFSIYCDASGQGLGCVLMHDGHVEAYALR
jgi:hypothetical protein